MLRAGFVGIGRMGITHFSILNTHPSVKTVAVCDTSKTMLNFFKKHVGVSTYTDYLKMFQDSALDFVVISTQGDSHAEIIKAAVQNDLHVFVEKPFVMNVHDGEEILHLLKGKRLVNQVGYVIRFNEVFMEVKKLLDSNILGELKYFNFEMSGNTVTRDVKSSWRSKRDSGGGCMYEFASHCIDLVNYLIGPPDSTTGNVLQKIFSSHVEDIVVSTFLYDRGCTGTMIVNWSDISVRKPLNRIEILGKNGKIIADRHQFKIYLNEPYPAGGFHEGWNTRYITDLPRPIHFYVRGNEFSYQLAYFVECIEEKRINNLSGFEEAIKADYIMQDIFTNCVEVRKNG